MPHDPEQKRLAGQKGRTHGIYSIQARGEAAMTPDQRQTLREIEESLETPEGIVAALRKRVALGVMVMEIIEQYLKQETNGGKSPDQIPLLKSWPAFQNSAIRALKQLMDTMPKPERDALAEEIRHVQQFIKESERQANETVVEPGVSE